AQPASEEGEIGVRRAARQDFVTDDQDTGGDNPALGVACVHSILGLVGPSCGDFHKEMRASAQSEEDCPEAIDPLPSSCGDHANSNRYTAHVMMGLASSEARDSRIKIHGPEAFEGMRLAGILAAETLDLITPHVPPGLTTGELDRLCHGFIVDHDAIPAPLDYRGFPKSICTSINHVVCHGIPGERRLMEGDILNIDVTVILDGWHGDTSRMFFVGQRVPVKARRLVDVTYEAMM